MGAVALVIAVAFALSLPRWYRAVLWTPDGLFYAAQMLHVRGETEPHSLGIVFHGAAARTVRDEIGPASADRTIDDPKWVRDSARFYHRRWLVPVLGALVYPWFGLRAVEVVSLVGYLLAGLLTYLLLRRRFSLEVAVVVSLLCLMLPAFRVWSFRPLTDSWGVALEAASLTSAVVVLRRGLTFLPLWLFSVGALSISRDVALALVAAAGWLAVRKRTRRHLALFGTGLAAALPAPLLWGTPLKEQLNWAFSGYRFTGPTSWHQLMNQYARNLHNSVVLDLRVHLSLVLLFGVALVGLWVVRTRGDEFLQLIRASAVFTGVYLALVPVYTDFRLELCLLPMVAVGIASLLSAPGWRIARTMRHRPLPSVTSASSARRST